MNKKELDAYKLSNIIRYSQQHKIKKESVAEHSFYVMLFIHQICEEFELDDRIKLLSLESGLLHDIPEIVTNDITYDVKQMVPEISALLQPYEEAVIKEQCPRAHKTLFHPDTPAERLAKRIVKHADILSVLQYCRNEESLGNRHFVSLRWETEDRLEESKDELIKLIIQYTEMEGKRYAEK